MRYTGVVNDKEVAYLILVAFFFIYLLVRVWCKIEFGESSFVIKRGPDHPLGKESPI